MGEDAGILALRLKPIYKDRAKENQSSMGGSLREKSHEVETPIRTDEAVASLANISSNTIRKIERIEEVAAPKVWTPDQNHTPASPGTLAKMREQIAKMKARWKEESLNAPPPIRR